ncbi:MAG: NADH-quinone oxidoreductase subunit M [Pseudomonadales bacterium]
MTLIALITLLVIGGILSWMSARLGSNWPRWISLLTLIFSLYLLWMLKQSLHPHYAVLSPQDEPQWWLQISLPWIERFGIQFQLGLDGLSFLLLVLTLALGIFSVLCSWSEIQHRVGFFHFNLMCTLAGIVGVFTALDLFLFFVFWEVMLVPMVMLIGIWGHEKRSYAAIKFFIFTQASSLLMLISIVTLVLWHFQATGELTFNYFSLLSTPLGSGAGFWLMLGFFIAFAVKIPVILVHSWLPDAHTQAPTAGSVILAAVLLKTGAYGLIRFTLPLFPQASIDFAPVAMLLAVIGILYGAKLAFAQQDLKRFIAYTSISHMGFVLLGIYGLNNIAMQGAVLQMVAHGISTAALFMIVGMIQERLHSRDLAVMGGLSSSIPRLAAFGLFFAVASLGLPGMANFVAEFLVLLGNFSAQPVFTIIAALGLVAAAIYSLAMLQRAFWGAQHQLSLKLGLMDLNRREAGSLLVLAGALLYFGIQPQSLLNASKSSVDKVITQVFSSQSQLADVKELSNNAMIRGTRND